MLSERFRPWGQLDWVLSKIPKAAWSILGCFATEDRCTSVWQFAQAAQIVGPSLFVEITEQHSRFNGLAANLKAIQKLKLDAAGRPSGGFLVRPLLERHENIVATAEQFIAIAGTNVIVDITCFPKRFFFPFVRVLLNSKKFQNLLVTYTVPESYYDGPLAEDHRPLTNLPLFGSNDYPEPKAEVAIVSIGFVPLGITELVDPERQDVKFKFLFPFPPGPPNFQRNWKFVAQLERTLPLQSEPIRVEANNVSDTFDHILELTDRGSRAAVFAPYGPKPMSLAMCLYAIQSGSAVYYTQPQTYHPQYSKGVRIRNGQPLTYAYCLRLDAHDFYTLS